MQSQNIAMIEILHYEDTFISLRVSFFRMIFQNFKKHFSWVNIWIGSRIERGEANCDVGKLFVICQCLEMSADYILFGEQKDFYT